MAQIRDVEKYAEVGEVVVSAEACALLDTLVRSQGFSFRMHPQSNGSAFHLCCQSPAGLQWRTPTLLEPIIEQHGALSPERQAAADGSPGHFAHQLLVSARTRDSTSLVRAFQPALASSWTNEEHAISAALEGMSQNRQSFVFQVLRSHIPAAVRDDIVAASHGSPLAGIASQFRVCTVLFVGFPHLTDPGMDEVTCNQQSMEHLTSVQASATVVAQALQRHHGSLLQFRCDEKG